MNAEEIREIIASLPAHERHLRLEEIMIEQGKKIDPDSAEVFQTYGNILDPYDIGGLAPEECLVGRLAFAQSHGLWVSFLHLPNDVRESLEERLQVEQNAGLR